MLTRLALPAVAATLLAACGSGEQLKQTASSVATKAKTELSSLTTSSTDDATSNDTATASTDTTTRTETVTKPAQSRTVTSTTTAIAPAHTTSVNHNSTSVSIQPISTPVATESASGVAWWVWVLIGLGAVGVCILIFQLGRGQRGDERTQDPGGPTRPRAG